MRWIFSLTMLAFTYLGAADESFFNHPLMQSENPSQDHFLSEFISMVIVLCFTLVVMLAIAWFLKRFLNARLEQVNVSSTIKVEERRSLGPKAMIYLVEIEGTRLVIGESPTGLVRLAQLPPSREFSDIMESS